MNEAAVSRVETSLATETSPSLGPRAETTGRKGQAHHVRNFAAIVSLLMRDPDFRNLRLSDVERLVLPALRTGQWRVAHARRADPKGPDGNGTTVPVAVALWASVSPEVDDRLSENLDKPLPLKPDEWASGNIPWLVAIAGDRKLIPQFMSQLDATVFHGKYVKMRTRDSQGNRLVAVTLRGEEAA